ncbi:cytochrome P450 [Streptomyces sp. BI20]|uniref:cytochrome P450 n=1 Tax=Streptomyces sp. BI20 TaxID=3403460 RepID=UPI003C783104
MTSDTTTQARPPDEPDPPDRPPGSPAEAASAALSAHPTAVHDWRLPDLPGLEFDPLLYRLLHEEPVARVRLPYGSGSAWLLTRYADVKAATADPRFSREALATTQVTSSAPNPVSARHAALNYADPPELTRMRRVVARAFTGKSMNRLRPLAQAGCDALLDRMEEAGSPADLMEHLHGPFPLAVVADLLGLEEEARARITSWATVSMSSGPDGEESKAARLRVRGVIVDLLERRRAAPEEDLASVLATAAGSGEITEDQAVSLATAILVSGAHAVRNNSANMVFALLTHPEQLARLRADPALLPQAVDELLRFIPHRSGVGIPRIATEDLEIGGVPIRAGEAVFASYLAANRDPAEFPDPDVLDFDRGPIGHLSFGNGPHHCVGSMVARMESEIMIETLLRRYPNLRLAVPVEELSWQKNALIRGPETLPVAW